MVKWNFPKPPSYIFGRLSKNVSQQEPNGESRWDFHSLAFLWGYYLKKQAFCLNKVHQAANSRNYQIERNWLKFWKIWCRKNFRNFPQLAKNQKKISQKFHSAFGSFTKISSASEIFVKFPQASGNFLYKCFPFFWCHKRR